MRISAAQLVDGRHESTRATIEIESATIASVDRTGKTSADLHCEFAVPSFIDIHTHGRIGYDTMDATPEAFRTIARSQLEQGTTAVLASTVTAPLEKVEAVLSAFSAYDEENRSEATMGTTARIAGVHLEGPWISKENLGAHDGRYATKPDDRGYELIDRYADIIRMVTFDYGSPESKRLLEFIASKNIIAALGHDTTIDSDAVEAFANGASHLTHAYSCSSSFKRRDGRKHLGSLEMGLITDGVSVEVIADDHHTTRYFWDFITALKPIDDIIVVSDSTCGAGMPEERGKVYTLGGREFIVEDGVAWLPDKSAYAGSVASMHSCFRTLVERWHVPIKDAVRVTSANPARRFSIDAVRRGIEPGAPANLVLLDDRLEIVEVIASGRCALGSR